MNPRTTWTKEAKTKLVAYVDKAVAEGKTKTQAYEEFCSIMGPEFKPSTASVVYTTIKNKQLGKRSSGYTAEDDRQIVLGAELAPHFGLTKRDVLRVIGERLGKTIAALEQRLSSMRAEFTIPDPNNVPEDILELLQQAEEFKREARIGRRRAQAEQNGAPAPVPRPMPESTVIAPIEAEDMNIIDVLSAFAKATKRIDGVDGEGLLKQLAVLATMAVDNSEVGNLRNELFHYHRENRRLANELEAVRRERDLLRAKLSEFDEKMEEVRRQQEVVDYIVKEFTSIRTIEQVGALKDYTNRIRVETDRLGNVIRSVDEWKEKFEEQLREIFLSQDALDSIENTS